MRLTRRPQLLLLGLTTTGDSRDLLGKWPIPASPLCIPRVFCSNLHHQNQEYHNSSNLQSERRNCCSRMRHIQMNCLFYWKHVWENDDRFYMFLPFLSLDKHFSALKSWFLPVTIVPPRPARRWSCSKSMSLRRIRRLPPGAPSWWGWCKNSTLVSILNSKWLRIPNFSWVVWYWGLQYTIVYYMLVIYDNYMIIYGLSTGYP